MTLLGVLHAGAALVRLGARLAGFAEPSPADMAAFRAWVHRPEVER